MVKSVGPLYDQLEKIEGLHLTSDYDCIWPETNFGTKKNFDPKKIFH